MSGDVIYRRLDGVSEFQLWLPMVGTAEPMGSFEGLAESVGRVEDGESA